MTFIFGAFASCGRQNVFTSRILPFWGGECPNGERRRNEASNRYVARRAVAHVHGKAYS
jgi:hypothetical protein